MKICTKCERGFYPRTPAVTVCPACRDLADVDPLVRAGTYATPERIAKARAFAETHFIASAVTECDTCGTVGDVEVGGSCRECYTDAVAHGGDL